MSHSSRCALARTDSGECAVPSWYARADSIARFTATASTPGGEEGPAARRRPKIGCEAYSLYVERPVEGGNEADGPSSAAG